MMPRLTLIVLLPTIAALLATAGCAKRTTQPATRNTDKPNILFISIESLRADHVGCYGYERPTSPNIDALAQQATLYEQAHSVTSWTLTSHTSMFTGLYPSAHRVTLPRDRLADSYTTIAEILATAGYQTAAVLGGPYLRKAFNLNQGFDYYDESVSASTNEAAHKDITNPRMATAMEQFLRHKRDPNKPFMLFAYYWDVHYDYIPPAPYDTMFAPSGAQRIDTVQFGPITKLGRDISQAQLDYVISQYDGEIRCTDEYLGRLWKLLRELDLWDNTAVILTADHGEQFFEHSYLGHKHDVYVESVHVPLIIKFPNQSKPVRNKQTVSLVDLLPTMADIAECPVATPYNGRSLIDESSVADPPIYFELTTNWNITDKSTGKTITESDHWVGIRSGQHRFVHVLGTGFWQLYDVVADPREQNPLAGDIKSVATPLAEQLTHWQNAMQTLSRKWDAGPQAQLSEEELERLRSLGYIGKTQ